MLFKLCTLVRRAYKPRPDAGVGRASARRRYAEHKVTRRAAVTKQKQMRVRIQGAPHRGPRAPLGRALASAANEAE